MTRHAMKQAMETIVTAGTKVNEEDQRLKLRVLRREIRKALKEVEGGRTVSAARAFAEVDRMLGGAPKPARGRRR